jgi:hypothetical protein
MSAGYDFSQLYGQANMTGMLNIPEDTYDMVCTKSEWGRSKDGTKGQWTVELSITTGPQAGTKMGTNITINPVKNDGEPNPNGLGMMFRDLSAFGVPIPIPPGWTEQGIAQFMVSKPVRAMVYDDHYEGDTRSKIRKFLPPLPGAPTQVQQAPQQQQQQYAQNGYGQPPQPHYAEQYPGQYNQPQQNGYGQQPAAPSWGGPDQQPGQPPQQTAPGPWQGAPAQVPGAPEWAQPAAPGQGGLGEFTQQGQSVQPGYGQQQPYGGPGPSAMVQGPGGGLVPTGPGGYPQAPPPQGPYGQPNADWNPAAQGYGAPAGDAPGPGAPYQQGAPSPSDQGQPAMPPWAQQQPQPGYQPQQPGPVNPPQDPNAAPPPPWAQ